MERDGGLEEGKVGWGFCISYIDGQFFYCLNRGLRGRCSCAYQGFFIEVSDR